MPEVGIVMTLNDKVSAALKTIAGNAKAFDKNIDELDAGLRELTQSQEGLIARQTGLKKALEASAVKVSDARKEYRRLKDETSKGALDAAIDEQAQLQRELKSTEAEIRLNNKAYDELSKSALDAAKRIQEVETRSESAAHGMKESARVVQESMGNGDGVLKKLKDSELSKMIGGAITDYVGYELESALGQPLATAVESTLSGITQGVSAGALFGPTGMMIGGAIGAVTGGIQGWTAVKQAQDDSFKSYVQENVEGRLAEMDSIRASGSATAGRREQDQLAFAQRFGSEEAARDYLDQVKAMAVNTNYSYDEITGYSKSLLNTYSPEDTLKVLQDLSDATAGLNLDSGGVSMFINGLARMRTTNKATQEYLNYFSERGLDVYDALSRSTGADKSAIAEMVSKGKISGTDAAQAILDYIQEEFGGLSEKLAGTYDAMVDNLGDAEANLNAVMGKSYNEARKPAIKKETDWLESGEMEEAYKAIGAWQAELENTKERLEREALRSVISGTVSGDYEDSSQKQRLEELAREYQALLAEQEEGSQDAGAKMGALLAEAKIIAANEYNASKGAQLALESEKALIQRVREDTELNGLYWNAGYTLGQEFSKGLAAGRGGAGGLIDTLAGAAAKEAGKAGFSAGDGNAEPTVFTPSAPEGNTSGIMAGYELSGWSSDAFGLARVPYDNFPALLHQGERVLTARETRLMDRKTERLRETERLTERERFPYLLPAREARPEPGAPAANQSAVNSISITVSGNTFGAGMDEAAVAKALADQIMLQIEAGGGRL